MQDLNAGDPGKPNDTERKPAIHQNPRFTLQVIGEAFETTLSQF